MLRPFHLSTRRRLLFGDGMSQGELCNGRGLWRFASVVVGSGEKGQTYLYWNEDQLFQSPVSYWTRPGWVDSPGYRDGFANFDRPIIPRAWNVTRPILRTCRLRWTNTAPQALRLASAARSVMVPAGNTWNGRERKPSLPFSYLPGEPLTSIFRLPIPMRR
jgi:hypothetical protein